jgi:hypothetical protein
MGGQAVGHVYYTQFGMRHFVRPTNDDRAFRSKLCFVCDPTPLTVLVNCVSE